MTGALHTLNKQWLTFVRLSWRQKFLYLESTFYLLASMLLVKFVPSRWWSKYLGSRLTGDSSDDSKETLETARDIARAIRRINRLFRGRFSCLMQAVAGKAMLNRRGIPNILTLGVHTHHDAHRGLVMKAHAWLRSGPTILLGGESHESFTTLAEFYSPLRGQ